ncbi:MAG: dephospho-CoA kinase, partial [Alishewanella sp. 32-51-5]
QVKAIMAAQLGRQQKLARADDIIDNNGSLSQLTEQIAHLHKKYLELSREIRHKEQ